MFFLWLFLIAWGLVNIVFGMIQLLENDMFPLIPSEIDNCNLFGQICGYIALWVFVPFVMLARVIRYLFTR